MSPQIMFAACNSVPLLCKHYHQDLTTALSLAESHPGRLLIAKYEEIVSSPSIAIPIIFKVEKNCSRDKYWKVSSKVNFQFLNLPWHSRIDSFIAEHMMMEAEGEPQPHFHAESKLSWTIAGKWKDKLAETELTKLRKGKGPLKYKSIQFPFRGQKLQDGLLRQIMLKVPFSKKEILQCFHQES